MQVIVALETRFERTPDGRVWTQTMNAYPFWSRYLAVFEGVRTVARVRDVSAILPEWQRADGEGVTFAALPDYAGLQQYLWKALQVRRAARNAFQLGDAVILRVSSMAGAILQAYLRQIRYPYGVEVVGDPYDVFSPGAFKHPLRPLFRWWFTRKLREQCARASAAAYVTAGALQARYPCPNYSVGVSDVEITDAALVSAPRKYHPVARPFTLITVGSLAHFYKGPDVLIEALARCIKQGVDLNLVLVGDGKHRSELQERVSDLGIEERVRFLGQLTMGDAVRAQLDRADLFVLPSRQEGLPRALVEAMARALPCIGSTVGGIPELLASEDLVTPGDAAGLAAKIREVLTNLRRLESMSARNLRSAREYHDDILKEKRLDFYRQVKEKTLKWQGEQGR
jgi:glycosyltransferase involved in cell wall biosynthesis